MRQFVSAIALSCLVFGASAAQGEILNFTTSLDGQQANNCAGTGSAGTGSGTFTLDTDTGEVSFNIDFTGLEGAETVSHVHGASPECVSSGVVYNLPTGNPKIGTDTLTAGEQADMINGLHYVNIHSTIHGGGELRGQVLLVQGTVPAVSEWGVAIMVLLITAFASTIFLRSRAATSA